MHILVKDIKIIEMPQVGARVRFSVTLVEGERALLTSEGWLLDYGWRVIPPATRTRFGGLVRYITVSEEFEGQIVAALREIQELQDAWPQTDVVRPREIPGEVRIK